MVDRTAGGIMRTSGEVTIQINADPVTLYGLVADVHPDR